MLSTAAATIAGAALLEGSAAALVYWLKRRCPWIITPADLDPPIDRRGLDKFLEHGWDAELGWIRKPNTANDEVAKGGGRSRFHIGPDGARRNPGFGESPPAVQVYGDSYAFARQVNDDETWTHQLSLLWNANVANRGVGNYGLDQAQLRLEREYESHPAPAVFMAVVPETICRVVSYWKHFSEYGNTFAFKPRFVPRADGGLDLLPNPADTPEKFLRIPEMLPHLQEHDYFYARKFTPDMVRFPYLWHLWRSRRRNPPLMAAALRDRLGGDGKRAFCRVMDRNIALTAALYGEGEPLDLMTAITERFAAFVRARGAEPALVILPQLYDLKHLRAGNHYYRSYIERVEDTLPTVDFGPDFAADDDDAANYIDDRFGGHFSAKGNRMVAQRLARECRHFVAQGEEQ